MIILFILLDLFLINFVSLYSYTFLIMIIFYAKQNNIMMVLIGALVLDFILPLKALHILILPALYLVNRYIVKIFNFNFILVLFVSLINIILYLFIMYINMPFNLVFIKPILLTIIIWLASYNIIVKNIKYLR